METRHGFYRERTWAPAWVVAILLTACLAAAGAVAYELYKSGPGGDGSMSMLGAVAAMAASLGLPILIGTLFARLDVEVQRTRSTSPSVRSTYVANESPFRRSKPFAG